VRVGTVKHREKKVNAWFLPAIMVILSCVILLQQCMQDFEPVTAKVWPTEIIDMGDGDRLNIYGNDRFARVEFVKKQVVEPEKQMEVLE
jgi:hypothetical protein